MKSHDRALQHLLGVVSEEGWLKGVDGKRPTREPVDLTDTIKEKIKSIRSAGNRRVKECLSEHLLPESVVRSLAKEGVPPAKDYCIYQQWDETMAVSAFNQSNVARLRTLAVIETAMSFNGAGHPRWKELFRLVSNDE